MMAAAPERRSMGYQRTGGCAPIAVGINEIGDGFLRIALYVANSGFFAVVDPDIIDHPRLLEFIQSLLTRTPNTGLRISETIHISTGEGVIVFYNMIGPEENTPDVMFYTPICNEIIDVLNVVLEYLD